VMAFREQAIKLGARDSLVGVLSLPADAQAASDVPAVVILNAGIIHRVGPNRLHVQLARALASCGFHVLRFDLSGIGDSENRPDGLPPTAAALADIREALDDLEASGRTRRGVILAGLCSGALHALLAAEADPRVVGTALVDLYLPKTFRYYRRHYWKRATSVTSWLSFLRGRNRLWRAVKYQLAPDGQREAFLNAGAPDLGGQTVPVAFERAFLAALDRGVQIFAVFTAGMEDQHNYREQLLEAFPRVPFGERLRLEYFADSDHTFSSEVLRARMVRKVGEWAASAAFPDPAASKQPPGTPMT